MICVVGTYLKVVHLIIHPILALTGDKISRFNEGSRDYGVIEVYNLESHANSSATIRNRIMPHLLQILGTFSALLERMDYLNGFNPLMAFHPKLR